MSYDQRAPISPVKQDIREHALARWLTFAPRIAVHPILNYGANRFLTPAGISVQSASFAAHSVLDGQAENPTFGKVTFDVSAASRSEALKELVEQIALCDVKIAFNLDANLLLTFSTKQPPSLLSEPVVALLNASGMADLQAWIWGAKENFTAFSISALLSIAVETSAEKWAHLFLESPEIFAEAFADEFALPFPGVAHGKPES